MAGLDVTFTFVPPRLDLGTLPQAVARGLNEAGDKVRTQVQQALRVETNVLRYRSITSRVRTIRATPGSARYEIVVPSRPIPLTEFRVDVTGKGVEADTWGVEHQFKRSFVLDGRFVARIGSGRFPIHRLQGPNLGKELHSPAVLEVFHRASAEFVAPLVLKHLARALG